MHAYGDVRGISYVIERMNTSGVAETLNTTSPLKEANLNDGDILRINIPEER
jgi:hypothetical protein